MATHLQPAGDQASYGNSIALYKVEGGSDGHSGALQSRQQTTTTNVHSMPMAEGESVSRGGARTSFQ